MQPLLFLGGDLLPNQTQCDTYNSNRQALKVSAHSVLGIGTAIKLGGAIISGLAKTVQTQQKIGIHGYVGLHIKTDFKGTVGKVFQGAGDGLISISSAVSAKLKRCEILYRQAEIMHSNEALKQSNEVLLLEICAITRFSSPNCQAIRP